MQIKSIHLKNFCQHEDRHVEFSPGLTAIVGANGAGKSNILNAIGFALTGMIQNDGTKNDNIRQQAAATAKSYVRLLFRHGDTDVTIQRNLRPKSPVAVLTYSSGEEIVGEAAVNAAIEALLGVPKDVISNMVVVSHEALFGFLRQAQSERLAQFQKLFNLDSAATIYDAVGKYVNTLTVPVITESTAELQLQIAATAKSMQDSATALAVIRTDTEIAEAVAQAEVVINNHAEASRLASQLVMVDTQLTNNNAAYNQVIVKSHECDLQKASITAAIDDGKYDAAKHALANHAVYTHQLQQKQLAQKAHQVAVSRLAAHNENPPVKDMAKYLSSYSPEQYAEQTAKRDELYSKQHKLQQISQLKDGKECPTCGSDVQSMMQRREAAKQELITVQHDYTAVTTWFENLAYTVQYDKTVTAYTEAGTLFTQAVADAETALTAASNLVLDVVNVDEAQSIIKMHNELKSKLTNLDIQREALVKESSVISGVMQQLLQQKNTLQQGLAALPVVDEAQCQQAVDVITAAKVDTAFRQQWLLYQATVTEQWRSATQRYNNTVMAQQRITKLEKLTHTLTRVRGIFHKEAAPALVIQSNLQRLEQSINDQLECFDADYRVKVADGASFTAHFSGGIVQPVQRLSYGQKVALAFAFRLALSRTIIPHVNGLYLDEPTAYLDSRRIDAFEPVFQQLRNVSNAIGLQCVIVTHEMRLSHLFDKVIEL